MISDWMPKPATSKPIYDSARRPHPFLEEWMEAYRYRDLIFHWALRNLKVRYKRSVLGILWTLLEPLMIMVVLTVVFSQGFRVNIYHYPVYILIGITLWDFFRRSTTKMMDEIIASESLARRIYVPRTVFSFASLLTYLISWAIAMIPLFGIMLVLHHSFSWAMLTLPLGLFIVALFALGMGMMVSTFAAFFHDISLMYQVILMTWMYATPIIYPLEIVPERFQTLIRLNPMTPMVFLVRDPIYSGKLPGISTWLVSIGWSLLAVFIGWWSYTHWRDRIDYRF